jgi:hypothetical protein
MKVETEMITSIISQRVQCNDMYVETFKTDVIGFIGNVIMYLTSH